MRSIKGTRLAVGRRSAQRLWHSQHGCNSGRATVQSVSGDRLWVRQQSGPRLAVDKEQDVRPRERASGRDASTGAEARAHRGAAVVATVAAAAAATTTGQERGPCNRWDLGKWKAETLASRLRAVLRWNHAMALEERAIHDPLWVLVEMQMAWRACAGARYNGRPARHSSMLHLSQRPLLRGALAGGGAPAIVSHVCQARLTADTHALHCVRPPPLLLWPWSSTTLDTPPESPRAAVRPDPSPSAPGSSPPLPPLRRLQICCPPEMR